MRGRACVLLALLQLAATAPRAAMVVEQAKPSAGPETGGNRVTFKGKNFPFFSGGVTVTVGGNACSDVRIERPFHSLSCVMPICTRCGTVPVHMSGADGVPANAIMYTFVETCFEGGPPLLPRHFSAAENCTVCMQMVAGVSALVGDAITNQALRKALQDVCDTSHFKSFGRTRELYCREDISAACTYLYHTAAHELADAMWNRWDATYLYGGLPQQACADVGRCARPYPADPSVPKARNSGG